MEGSVSEGCSLVLVGSRLVEVLVGGRRRALWRRGVTICKKDGWGDLESERGVIATYSRLLQYGGVLSECIKS
jgi:hypothetical protein